MLRDAFRRSCVTCASDSQLVRQYPASFEFTGHYLERLVEALYSAAFLTFTGKQGDAVIAGQNALRNTRHQN